MVKREIIKPKKDYVLEKRYIKKLYKDCGYKSHSSFKCGICDYEVYENLEEGEKYDKCKPKMIEHIINKHPNFCYSCSYCNNLFCNQEGFKNHVCEKKIEDNIN